MNSNTSILRRASTHASTTTTSSRITPSIQTRRSTDSRVLDEVLHDGDEIGPGLSILGQPIRIVNARTPHVPTMRVIRKLGTGSYAVVYLVQEVIPYSDSFLPPLEDSPPPTPAPTGGRYFAVKCLAKHAQDQDAQLLEAEIHQSLPVHDNVVTLWNTLETASYLLLVLDYVPGEDLFYFLEQSRDHEPADGSTTTPALLASLHPEELLSTRRLRLIASMFSQMCEAVAHCHRNGVFHRDIKPENFMVTDSRVYNPHTGKHERRVSVKLTDFGLATRDTESGDMDCGSAPYMSFECHNNITPTYATAPADVWSLGIVLINMLYHANPWLTTAAGQCESFDYFLREPIPFFMNRFPGMTPAVAEFFARGVFCLLGDQSSTTSSMTSPVSAHHPSNTGRRITAEQFGQWSRDLQLHLGPSARRTPALAFQQPPNHAIPRPRSPGETSSRLMAPSVSQPGTRTPSPSYRTRPPVPIHADAIANRGPNTANYGSVDLDSDSDSDDGGRMRTTSSSKRRKRALRGNKAQPMQPSSASTVKSDAALYAASVLAAKSQAVAREASLIKSAKTPPSTYTPLTPAATPVATTVDLASRPATPSRVNTVTPARSTPELRTKKSTKWTDIFKRDSGSDQEVLSAAEWAAMDKQEERTSLSSPPQTFDPPAPAPSATAKNIASLIMGLDSTAPSLSNSLDDATSWNSNGGRSSSLSSRGRRKDRRGLDRDSQRAVSPGSLMSVSTASTGLSNGVGRGRSAPSNDRQARSKSPTQVALAHHLNVLVQPSAADPPPVPSVPEPYRASVPVPVDATQVHGVQQSSRRSYAPSIASVSTATTSSSGFTAFSGKNKWRASNSSASVRSVSTNATSLSSGSWRSNGTRPPLPSNIKPMDGVPWILDELPRQPGFSDKKKDSRRRAPSTPTPSGLGTIAEKPKKSAMKPPRSPIASSFNQARFNGTPYTGKADGENAAGYQPGLMNSVGSFDPSGTSFGVARGGPPMGLQINTDTAIGPSPGVDGGGTTVTSVALGAAKPPKTPTKSRLWPQNWRK